MGLHLVEAASDDVRALLDREFSSERVMILALVAALLRSEACCRDPAAGRCLLRCLVRRTRSESWRLSDGASHAPLRGRRARLRPRCCFRRWCGLLLPRGPRLGRWCSRARRRRPRRRRRRAWLRPFSRRRRRAWLRRHSRGGTSGSRMSNAGRSSDCMRLVLGIRSCLCVL